MPPAGPPPLAELISVSPRPRHDPRNFALCSGTLEEGVEVLFVSADNEADAALWVSAIAGRLYTNELRIDEDLVVEYIAIFQHFDVDANQRISMEELGAVTRALGKSKSPEELPGMCEELGLNVDAMGLTLPQARAHHRHHRHHRHHHRHPPIQHCM